MADKKIYLVGFLTIIVLISGVVYINLDNLKIRVDSSQTTFYILEDSRWRVAGREINSIWDGSSRMNRNRKEITVNLTIEGNFTQIIRTTPYIRGAIIRDTYTFRGDIKEVELFPVSHKIEVINGNICGERGCIYEYQVKDLVYTGETKRLETNEMSFGRNMKVEWDSKFYYAKIYKYKNQDKGKLIVRYRITSDYEVFYNRLFDPASSNTTLYLDELSADRYYEHGTICELKANVTNLTGNILYREWCYQETANVSTGCGGLDMGSYSISGSWWDDSSLIIDGNFSTRARPNLNNHGYLYVNYTKPNTALSSSIWKVKDEGGTENLTIPLDCFNYNTDKLIFYVDSYYPVLGVYTKWYCKNSTGWRLLRSGSMFIYEEAMWWEIQDNATICLNIDQVGYGDDFICGNGSVSYNLTTNAVKNTMDSTCYQESANVSTVCGGLSTGSYNCEGNWSEWTECKFTYDGNWSHTYGSGDTNGTLYINYTKPADSTIESLWRVRSNISIGYDSENLTIPQNCWNQNPLQFKVNSIYIPPHVYWSCNNGTGWQLLYDDTPIIRVYEEGIYWDFKKEKTNLTYNSAPENQTIYLKLNRYDEIQSAYINLAGYENTSYPLNVKIYVNDTLVDSINGLLGAGNQTLDEFNNSNTIENLSFSGSSTKTRYLKLPKTANVTTAYLDLKGYPVWESNSSIVLGLGDVGVNSLPEVYEKDSIWHLISGENYGEFYGFQWNGTSWVSNSSIVSGLGDVGFWSSPTVYQKDSIWHLISGEGLKEFYGYQWNGSSWVENSTIVSGLVTDNYYSNPEVYQKDSIWHLIYGHNRGRFGGYQWNGSSWVENSTIVSGLGDVGWYSKPEVYQKDSVWYLISGEHDGIFNGYYWSGNQWISNPELCVGLGDIGAISSPTVYQKDSVWTLISGEQEGGFYGFQIGIYPTNSYIQSADSSGVHEWNYSGEFNTTDTANLNATLINTYLASCTADSEGYCNVPILFYSGSAGILEVSNIGINYTCTIDPTRDISASTIQTYLDSQSSGFHNVPIKISSENNTIIQVDNINITYFGSDNISVTAHFDGDGTYSASNDTAIVKVQYSNYNYSIEVNYGYIEFIAPDSDSLNVTPYGQRNNQETLLLFDLAYDQNANYSIALNETYSCINVTASSNSSKSAGILLNTSYQDIATNLSLGDNFTIHFWADYNCTSSSSWRWWRPLFMFSGTCINCVK